MKICGTVRKPWARSIISARLASSKATSISANSSALSASSRLAARQYPQNGVV